MKNNYNKFDKNINNDENLKNVARKDTRDYSYYSRVLEKPFDSIGELKEAEATYYAQLRAKEDKAAAKKADAKKVEDAFKGLNAARKIYKEDLTALTEKYGEDLVALKNSFNKAKQEIQESLAKAEETYEASIKAFTEKYPEGYHLTLKDGDFETTISGSTKKREETSDVLDVFNWIFNFLN